MLMIVVTDDRVFTRQVEHPNFEVCPLMFNILVLAGVSAMPQRKYNDNWICIIDPSFSMVTFMGSVIDLFSSSQKGDSNLWFGGFDPECTAIVKDNSSRSFFGSSAINPTTGQIVVPCCPPTWTPSNPSIMTNRLGPAILLYASPSVISSRQSFIFIEKSNLL